MAAVAAAGHRGGAQGSCPPVVATHACPTLLPHRPQEQFDQPYCNQPMQGYYQERAAFIAPGPVPRRPAAGAACWDAEVPWGAQQVGARPYAGCQSTPAPPQPQPPGHWGDASRSRCIELDQYLADPRQQMFPPWRFMAPAGENEAKAQEREAMARQYRRPSGQSQQSSGPPSWTSYAASSSGTSPRAEEWQPAAAAPQSATQRQPPLPRRPTGRTAVALEPGLIRSSVPMSAPTTPTSQAPTVALNLLKAEPSEGREVVDAVVVESADPTKLPKFPRPLCVRNTFIDTPPDRSPSLERFFEERKIRSSPPSGRLEVAVPANEPGHCDIFDAVRSTTQGSSTSRPSTAGSARFSGAQGLTTELELATSSAPINGLVDFSGLASWQQTPPSPASTSSHRQPSAPDRTTLEAPAPPSDVVVGSPQMPSRGSLLHAWGTCKPCAFVFQEGCKNALECQFCHLCEPGERKRRKKERLVLKREARETARRRRSDLAGARSR